MQGHMITTLLQLQKIMDFDLDLAEDQRTLITLSQIAWCRAWHIRSEV